MQLYFYHYIYSHIIPAVGTIHSTDAATPQLLPLIAKATVQRVSVDLALSSNHLVAGMHILACEILEEFQKFSGT